jgi:monoterpene epsilon-lactone hydrolase
MDHHTKASRYEIHIAGLLGERLLAAFPELHAQTLEIVTVLVGDLPDQAALHRVLSRVESLGLVLLEVRRAKPARTRRVPPGQDGA